ncbi:AraC family transcriptional regulator [Algibacter sp. AS12]|uniref:helix-turn-helix domain-containing protein n=1 Tax=Algibacter sp. AS12 TaxID=3135773 RepID=UPI00398B1056
MNAPKLILIAFLSLATNLTIGQESDSILQKINNYISLAKLDSAKIYIQTNLEKVKGKQDRNELNYQLVKVLFVQGDYNQALKQAFKSLDSINDEAQKVRFNFMIACVYSAIKDYDKSISYFDLVIKHNLDTSFNIKTHVLLAQLFIERKDSISAGFAFSEAYKLTQDKSLNVHPKLKDHIDIQYHFFNKNYEICKQQNFKIIKDSTSFLNNKSLAYSMIGSCLVKQDSLLLATTYFDEFLNLTFETKDPEQIKAASKKLIDVYEKLGNQEKANTYHKIYNEAENDTLNFSIEKYRDLYTLEKNRELKVIKSKNLKRNLIYGSIFILIIALGFYFVFRRKIEKFKFNYKDEKTPGKKIVISDSEIDKIEIAIKQFIKQQLFLKPNITRKTFCLDNDIKSERYLSQYINDKYKKSFSVFINDLRVDYAYNRIQNDKLFRNLIIEEIAKACGFGSKKSFERAFQAKYNETPYKIILRLTS